MHMVDSLLSPAVGGAALTVAGGAVAVAARRVRVAQDDRKIPLMGVLGAFVFAAQMVNFTIPGTGSSGHLGGGMILTALLGPAAAFLTMASILTVQALLFADGGLLALGCNLLNLGAIPAFIAYPLVFAPVAGRWPTAGRLAWASLLAAVVGLQLGAFAVVGETVLSGISELPFAAFVLAMQPIHLAIGLVEGVVTAAVLSFIGKARPGLVEGVARQGPTGPAPTRRLLLVLLVAALVIAGGLSFLASEHPDGLEWAISRVAGTTDLPAGGPVRESLAKVQERTAAFPEYGVPGRQDSRAGTAAAGLVGGIVTLAVAVAVGLAMRRRRKAA